ncbi:MAG TPA: galactose-1-phosphate uridylyltransferase, partial [Candidatus Altiarchaeales archaeon]|nr:galactose-1-phosphate uridylyltransferase [Candidatus Altiarchaeales archaeon]
MLCDLRQRSIYGGDDSQLLLYKDGASLPVRPLSMHSRRGLSSDDVRPAGNPVQGKVVEEKNRRVDALQHLFYFQYHILSHMACELRKDYLLDRWVIIAGGRNKRPSEFVKKVDENTSRKTCFFCPGNEETTPPEIWRIPDDAKKWGMRLFPNKFPAVSVEDGEHIGGLLECMPAYGTHEVLVETPVHGKSFADFTVKQMRDVLNAYETRIRELEATQGVGYVCVFKNQGKASGASIAHSHSQIITLPRIPPLVKAEVQASKKYFRENERCVFCDIAKKESAGERLVFKNKDAVAFTPYASRFPFETWIAPVKHARRIGDLDGRRSEFLAEVMVKTFGKMKSLLDDPSYNMIV